MSASKMSTANPLAGPPLVAAVTLAPEGGGIAAVSRMTWRVLSTAWPESRLVTLLGTSVGHGPTRPGLGSQLRFGAELMSRQLGSAGWVFFNHLALARAQTRVPRRVRRPHVVFLHGIEAWRPLPEPMREILGQAAVLIANSQHTATQALAANPGLGAIEICPLALERDDILSDGDARDVRRAGGAVLMVGRLVAAERYKGHDQMLEAWPAVRARVPSARLVIAGGGDDRGRLELKARALGVADAVEFTGFVSDAALAGLYREASAFAMPSLGEGFGLVYLEAMAHRLPCIGSRQDAAREVITDGVTGYLVDQADVPSLTDRLVDLLTDEARRRAMGDRGRDRVRSTFTYRQFADRLIAALAGAGQRLAPARKTA